MRLGIIFILIFCFQNKAKSQPDTLQSYIPPHYIGGKKALDNYLIKYIRYPRNELEYGVEAGLSAVVFITKEGKIRFVNVLGGNDKFRKVVKRVLTLMPEWECAKVNGNPIDTFVIKRFVFSQERLKFPHDSDIFELNYYTYWPDEKEERLMEIKGEMYDEKRRNWNKIYKKGLKELEKENFKAAIDYFNQSIELGNTYSELYYNMSVAFFNLGDYTNNCFYLREAALRGDEDAFKEYLKTCRPWLH